MTRQILVGILTFLSTSVYCQTTINLGKQDYRLETPTLTNAAECRYAIKNGELNLWRVPSTYATIGKQRTRLPKYYKNIVVAQTAINQNNYKHRFGILDGNSISVSFACKCKNTLIKDPEKFCYEWSDSFSEVTEMPFCINPFQESIIKSRRVDKVQIARQLWGDKQVDPSYNCLSGQANDKVERTVKNPSGCGGLVVHYNPSIYFNFLFYHSDERHLQPIPDSPNSKDIEVGCRCGVHTCEFGELCNRNGNLFQCDTWYNKGDTYDNNLPRTAQKCYEGKRIKDILDYALEHEGLNCKCGGNLCNYNEYCYDGQCSVYPKCISGTNNEQKCLCGASTCDVGNFCDSGLQCVPKCNLEALGQQTCYYEGTKYTNKFFRSKVLASYHHGKQHVFQAFDISYDYCSETDITTLTQDCVYGDVRALKMKVCKIGEYFHGRFSVCSTSEKEFMSLFEPSKISNEKEILGHRIYSDLIYKLRTGTEGPLKQIVSYVAKDTNAIEWINKIANVQTKQNLLRRINHNGFLPIRVVTPQNYINELNIFEISEQATFNVQRSVFSKNIFDYLTYFNINLWGTSLDEKSPRDHLMLRLLVDPSVHITNEHCAHDHIWDETDEVCVPLHCPEGYSNQVFPSKVLNKEIMARSIIYAQSYFYTEKESLYKIDRINRYLGIHIKDSRCHKCRTGYYCPNAYTSKKCPSGEYQDEEGQTSCKKCDSGGDSTHFLGEKCHYNTNPCQKGAFLYQDSLVETCLWCPGGHSLEEYSFDSEKDIANLIIDGTNMSPESNTCQSCSAGKYSPSMDNIVYSAAGSFDETLENKHSDILRNLDGYNSSIHWLAIKDGRLKSTNINDGLSLLSNLSTVQNDLSYFKETCHDCPAGRFSSRDGMSICEKCPCGFFAETGSSSCSECKQGFYSELGASKCTKANIDMMNTAPASCTTEYCPPGKYVANSNKICVNCPAGYYKNRYEGFCIKCSPGKYNPEQGSSSVHECLDNPVVLGVKEVTSYGYASHHMCPTGTMEDPPGRGNLNNCKPCVNAYTFPFGRVEVLKPATVDSREVVQWIPPQHLKCETCPPGRGIQFTERRAWLFSKSSGKKRDFGFIRTNIQVGSPESIKHTPVVGRFCETCPPGKYNEGNSAFCTECDYYEATPLDTFISIYSPSEPCGGAKGYGFLNSPLHTKPHTWTKTLDFSRETRQTRLVKQRNLHNFSFEIGQYRNLIANNIIPAELYVHPQADILRKTCYNSEGCTRLLDGTYECKDPKPHGEFMGDMRWQKHVVPCDDLNRVSFMEMKETWNSEKTYTMCEEGFVPDVSDQFCLPCRPQTKLGTHVVHGGWHNGLCLKNCPSAMTSSGAQGNFNHKDSDNYYECYKCNYPINIYGECQSPKKCPDGTVAVKRWTGDSRPECHHPCAGNQYRDGYKNNKIGSMQCFDCRTTEGFYAYKTDRFLEARECKKAPLGYLVNNIGDNYIHENDCLDEQIQGLQCMGQAIEICAPGKYWSGSECSAPPNGKKTKRGAYANVNVFDECPPGTKTNGTACIECPYWQYQPVAGQDTCENCPGGTEYGPESGTGKTTCEVCPEENYSWNKAQEITFEKAKLLFPDVTTDNMFNHNMRHYGNIKGYIWGKKYQNVQDAIQGRLPWPPDKHFFAETQCNENIYCSGLVRKIGYVGSRYSLSFMYADFYFFTTVPITREMEEQYPEMENAQHYEKEMNHVIDEIGSEFIEWSFLKKDDIREALHSVEAHRNPFTASSISIFNSLSSCGTCQRDFTNIILDEPNGYPYVDTTSENQYVECTSDYEISIQWQREVADCINANTGEPTGLWVPEITYYLSDYIFDENGKAVLEQLVVPAHCEKDKNETKCSSGLLEIEPAKFDSINRMISRPVCWDSMNVTDEKVFIYKDELANSLKDIPQILNNVNCHSQDFNSNATNVGTKHIADDWTPRNNMGELYRDVDMLNRLKLTAVKQDGSTANILEDEEFDVEAKCEFLKIYAHSNTEYLNALDESLYDDIICPNATYKCDDDITTKDGKNACENTGNEFTPSSKEPYEVNERYFDYKYSDYKIRTVTRYSISPSTCKDSNGTVIETGTTEIECEKTGRRFKIECPEGDKRLWHIVDRQLQMVSTNLYTPPKCDNNYYISESDCGGVFTNATCRNQQGVEVDMESPAECVMTQEYAHICDHFGNNNIFWTSQESHYSPMSLFCRQFDADPYQYSGHRQYIYQPNINAVIRLAHENKREFDVVVYKNDNDNDGIHDRDDSCPETPTTRAFNFVSSDGCSYEQTGSIKYKEYLYEQFCSNIDDDENHQDCTVFTNDNIIATDTSTGTSTGSTY